MSKHQESLDLIDRLARRTNGCYGVRYEENRKLLQELVDKATPKKVTREVIGMITHVQCPTCKRVTRHETSGTILRFCTNHKYCSSCGQALDWSKDE